MLQIGISTQKSRDVDSSTTVDVEEMKIASSQNRNVRTVAERRKLNNHAPKLHIENQRNHSQLKHRDKLLGQQLADKRKAVCCLMQEEAAVNNTEDSIMIEAMEFVASLHIAVVMAMKIILRRSKNANSFVMMLLACAI
jgi:hypothetical protein